ncbi:MAG: hypothetical protein WBF83_08050 [Moheibacter sp.]
MTTLQTLTILISFGLLSCNNNRTETTVKSENVKADSVLMDTAIKSQQQSAFGISDTIERFVVDDYPITNTMLADKTSNNSSYKKQSGQTYSYDKAWFSNDTLKQTLVFELYTDYHRMVTYHFYNNDIPTDLINRMELHVEGGELASENQKLKDFNGFLKQTTKINATNFITDKGFRLGDSKQKAIDNYGKPDKQSMSNGIEKIEWEFIGDTFYDGKTDLKSKPLAKDSYSHQVVMYFKNGKLIGQILHNDIP